MVRGPKQEGDTDMRTRLKTLAVASTLVAGLAAAPVLYSQGTGDTSGSGAAPMDQGKTMDHGHGNAADQGKTQGHGGMMGMMKTQDQTDQMNQMIEAHDKMMQAMLDAHGAAKSDKK